jgi:hypothetical protein
MKKLARYFSKKTIDIYQFVSDPRVIIETFERSRVKKVLKVQQHQKKID